jgi:uncharacterized protein YndB with AHSA1/START domain
MNTQTVRLHRILRSTPDQVYRAFLEPDAWAKWLPPHGFTGQVHELQARVGGRYRMSFTHHASGARHSFGGEYLELVPNEKLRYTARFEDPGLPGEMQTTITLRAVPSGVELVAVQEGIPQVIPLDGCYLGWQASLQLLALLVEGEGSA